MKYETISGRETTFEHFEKRDIAWHGFGVQYFTMSEVIYEDGSIKIELVQKTVYIDQILEDSKNQDASTVFTLLDACLADIHNELPMIREIIPQTDNDNYYQVTLTSQYVALLNKQYVKYNLRISEHSHIETQDGKIIIDGHFS